MWYVSVRKAASVVSAQQEQGLAINQPQWKTSSPQAKQLLDSVYNNHPFTKFDANDTNYYAHDERTGYWIYPTGDIASGVYDHRDAAQSILEQHQLPYRITDDWDGSTIKDAPDDVDDADTELMKLSGIGKARRSGPYLAVTYYHRPTGKQWLLYDKLLGDVRGHGGNLYYAVILPNGKVRQGKNEEFFKEKFASPYNMQYRFATHTK